MALFGNNRLFRPGTVAFPVDTAAIVQIVKIPAQPKNAKLIIEIYDWAPKSMIWIRIL